MAVMIRGFASLVVTFFLILLLSGTSLAVSANDGFNPNANGDVLAAAVQPDGKVVIGGAFTTVGGEPRNYLARLNLDGSVDPGFNPAPNYLVNSVAVQDDGKILVGGMFTSVGGVTRNYLARLNADGSVDAAYHPDADQAVSSLVMLPNGKLLIGGSFTTVGGAARRGMARLLADGSVDNFFQPQLDGSVSGMALQSDDKVVIAGSFTTVSGSTRQSIARLNADGTADTSFASLDPDNSASAVAIQADGKIIAGGWFTTLGGWQRNHLARLNPDGTVDASFNPNPNNHVRGLLVQPDGKLLISGLFATVGAASRQGIARLNADGSLDNSFRPAPDLSVSAAVLQPGGGIIIGGSFTTVGGVARNHIARLARDGSVDATLNLDLKYGTVVSTPFQRDGSMLATGFNSVGTVGSLGLFRVKGDGTMDAGFAPTADNTVTCSAVQPDGKMVIGGYFTSLNWTPRSYLARLNADGSIDSSFTTSVDNYVLSCQLQPQGKIVIAGLFTTVNGVARSHIARLNADGTLDTSFDGGTDYEIHAALTLPDGKIMIGGYFLAVGPGLVARSHLARLNGDGSLDASFTAQADGIVQALALQPDGSVLIGGSYSAVGGVSRANIARITADGSVDTSFDPRADGRVNTLALQADGRIITGGIFTSMTGTPRRGVALLNADGSLDGVFDPAPNNNVNSAAIGLDGKVVLGGYFSSVGGEGRSSLARLSPVSPAVDALAASADGRTVTWTRTGALPEIYGVSFYYSSDQLNWTALGSGTRSGSGWVLNGATLPAGTVYLKGAGIARGGSDNGSSWWVESVALVNTAPPAPVAAAATALADGFTASWTSAPAAYYLLDVALDGAFTDFVPGYRDLNVGRATSFPVTGLDGNTGYFYRVRGYNGSVSDYSNTVTHTTGNWSRLTIGKSGNGAGTVFSSPNGIMCGSFCTKTYTPGSTVTLTVLPDGWAVFQGWSGACSGTGPCTVTVSGSVNVTASFSDQGAPGTWASPAGGTYRDSQLVSLSCSDPGGSGCDKTYYCLGTDCTPSQLYSQPIWITGTTDLRWFSTDRAGNQEQVQTWTYNIVPARLLTVTTEGSGDGNVSGGGINCSSHIQDGCSTLFEIGGATVLTANPSPGSTFAGWGGACSSATGTECTLSMYADQTVTARFEIDGVPPEVVASGDVSGASINSLGEVVWSQHDASGQSQIFSSLRGQITLDYADHSRPAINDWGDMIWVSNSMLEGIVGGKRVNFPMAGSSADLNNRSEIVWIRSDESGYNQVYSNLRGQLTRGAMNHDGVSINNRGDVVFTESDPASWGANRILLLAAGTTEAVAVAGGNVRYGAVALNDGGEVVWSQFDLATSSFSLVSSTRGRLLTGRAEFLDLNNCGDLIYNTFGPNGPTIYRFGKSAPCASYPGSHATAEEAAAVSFGDIFTGLSDSATAPVSWYRFDATAGDSIYVSVNYNRAPNLLNIGLYDGAGNLLSGATSSTPLGIKTAAPYSGSYYLKVEGPNGRFGYSVSLSKYSVNCGAGVCPDLVVTANVTGASINSLGEVVWSQNPLPWNEYDPATWNSEVFSSLRGQLTFDYGQHRGAAINDLGDLVWGSYSGVEGLIGGKSMSLSIAGGTPLQLDLNNRAEVVWSQPDESGNSQIYSNLRGQLTRGALNHYGASINSRGDVVFTESDPASWGANRILLLAAGTTEAVVVAGGNVRYGAVAINDGGEVVWSQNDLATSSYSLVSSTRGRLLTGWAEFLDLNNCGDVIYNTFGPDGPSIYRFGKSAPCASYPGSHATFEEAATVKDGEVATAIADTNDAPVSWYRFEAAAGETVQIPVYYEKRFPNHLQVSVYDAGGTPLSGPLPDGTEFTVPADGSYYLKVEAQGGRFGYSLSVKRQAPRLLKLVVDGLPEAYFSKLSEVLLQNPAAQELRLYCREGEFAEEVQMNLCEKTLRITGGLDAAFSAAAGASRIKGALKVSCGKVVADGIVIR